MKGLACICAFTAVLASGARGGMADGPPSFHLTFDGKHNANLWHEGSFTTTSPFCPSGAAADVQVNDVTLTAMRRFTCTGSGDDFTARVAPLPAEHGGSGTWQIVAGTGQLADLRGKGTFTSVRLQGSPDDLGSITFESTWTGVADFDATPPRITVPRATARKLGRPKGAYRLGVTLALADSSQPVSYTLLVVDPRKKFDPLAAKAGQTKTGTVVVSLRVRPTKLSRTVTLHVDTLDILGNTSSLTRTLRLPRK